MCIRDSYFRMGVTGKNTGTTPRYAKVKIQWYGGRYGTGDDAVSYTHLANEDRLQQ